MHTSRLRLVLALAVSLAITACATRIPFELEESAAPIDRTTYLDASKAGANIYEIVSSESLVLIHVGRTGSMANLGHDHAVASVDLEGLIAVHPDSASSFADIAMPLKNLVVDNQAHRQQLELASEPSEKDIAGTYSNMQRMLEAEAWPWVTVRVTFANTEPNPNLANASISLHGVIRQIDVPLQLNVNDERMSVSGRFSLTQSDYGITPFSALGGLLRVADELDVRLELTAERRVP